MSLSKITLASLLVVGLCLPAAAQTRSAIVYPEDGTSSSENLELRNGRAVRNPPTYQPYIRDTSSAQRSNSSYHTAQRLGDYPSTRANHTSSHRLRQASYAGPMGERVSPAPSPELNPIPENSAIESTPAVEEPGAMQYEPLTSGDGPLEGSAPCDGGDCDGCCECGGEYCNDCNRPLFGFLCDWGHRNLAIFGGVHGYKGPRDRGLNGNFGFQEGLNYGAPLGDPWGCGFQIGFQALQSDISGNQVSGLPSADRHQYFATAGIFRRAEVGKVQWAIAFDYLHDTYNNGSDLKQLRSETGWLFNEQTEIGYSGAYGISSDTSSVTTVRGTVVGRLAPTDQFVLYIRRYFENGGDGRLFGGITGNGDGLLGADVWIPLGGSWALQNDFAFLIPKQGRGATMDSNGVVDGGQVRETWGVAMNLVWYPGRSSRCIGESCYRPILNVADNSQFMVNQTFSQ
jgi:hypothetical protein